MERVYNHTWEAPYVVALEPRIVEEVKQGERVHTARQRCGVCGRIRNPFTLAIIDAGRGQGCLNAAKQEETYAFALERVEFTLRALESDGRNVTGLPSRNEATRIPA